MNSLRWLFDRHGDGQESVAIWRPPIVGRSEADHTSNAASVKNLRQAVTSSAMRARSRRFSAGNQTLRVFA